MSLLNSFLTILLCSNSFFIISIATEGVTFPQVKKSKLIIPFSGNVWKLMWLSANSARMVKPWGSNLYLDIFKIVTLAAFAISWITFSNTAGSYSFVVPIISRYYWNYKRVWSCCIWKGNSWYCKGCQSNNFKYI